MLKGINRKSVFGDGAGVTFKVKVPGEDATYTASGEGLPAERGAKGLSEFLDGRTGKLSEKDESVPDLPVSLTRKDADLTFIAVAIRSAYVKPAAPKEPKAPKAPKNRLRGGVGSGEPSTNGVHVPAAS